MAAPQKVIQQLADERASTFGFENFTALKSAIAQDARARQAFHIIQAEIRDIRTESQQMETEVLVAGGSRC